jgi:2-dehydropantoate 2-reductase
MRMAVMAAAAVGGYFGGRMAAAGHDVAFIARGAHRDAIRRDGLGIESTHGDLHLKDVNVTDDPKQVGPVDVVLFAVKLWDTEMAGEQTRPLVGSNTRVITLQNGVDSVERLAPILGDDATIGGSTYVVTTVARTGVIRQTGPMAKVHCGRLDGRPDPVTRQLRKADQGREHRHHADGSYASRNLEEIRIALWHLRHYGKHAPAPRGHPRRRGHASFLLQADARDDGCRSCGGRRVPVGLRSRARSLGDGFSANDESLDGKRP